MQKQWLHEGWNMRVVGEEETIPANVPGSVYNDLLTAGQMEDPYWRDNELDALKRMDKDYEYRTEFVPEEGLLQSDRVVLRFEGLDTIADIYLNGELLGQTANMHRTWDYEVLDLLLEGQNELRVVFHSPTRYIKEAYAENPAGGSSDAMEGFALLRKAHCMFGWDWGPRLPDAGIWRPVSLLGIRTAMLDSVYITQHHEANKVSLELEVELDCTSPDCVADCTDSSACGLSYEVILTAPDGSEEIFGNSPDWIDIADPKLWWPNGYGEQNLYTIEVRLLQNGVELDTWKRRIGLRTMTMHIEPDQYGESFAHEVNGISIFAMGADYIPEDNILSRVTKERTRQLLEDCKAAHFNVIRVWGGGHYPSDDFYDLCDELGLIVWQDFMFACAVYNLTEEFEETITAEFIDNIKRLRHHASLGLWCGNNEMEQFVAQDSIGYDLNGMIRFEGMLSGLSQGTGWMKHPRHRADYIKMYEYLIPKVLKEFDPNTFYWPASPSSGGSFDLPNDPNRGDVHYWDVWHGGVPFTSYRQYFFRYVSEFGFQSFPSLKTIESFTEPEDRNIFSYVMEKHQRNNAANGKIMNYMSATYLYPNDFSTLLYASQLLQADAIRYGVEHFRRNRGRCMGAVYWQLNDCWPVASWASIDYFGRWKALHYYAKRFFAPVMLSCQEEGILTQDTNVNAEPYEVKRSITLCLANETREEVRATIRWALRDRFGSVLREEETPVIVEPLHSLWLEPVELPEARLYEDYVSYEAVMPEVEPSGMTSEKVISSGTVIFSVPKHFHFADPKLSVRLEGEELVITAQAYAKSVEILNEYEDLRLADNYFDMNAGQRRVKILAGKPEGLRVRSVYDIR